MLHQNYQLDSVLKTEYNRTRDVIINLPFLSWFYLFTAKKELDSFHHLFAICHCKILHLFTFFMKLLCFPSRWTLVSTRTKKILHFQVWPCCGKWQKSCLPARMYALQRSQNRPVDGSMSRLLRKLDRLLPVRKCRTTHFSSNVKSLEIL